ncbi:MAG: alpha/beta fold hydrolase [Acidimicrobiia bacterium]|nr:alpha/beta fold hydrolase [Acidimicrobiia bacterium]
MSAGKRALKVAGITVGVAAGLVGAGYAAQRAVRHGLSNRPDPDAGVLDEMLATFLASVSQRRLPSHDGGSIQVFDSGSQTPDPSGPEELCIVLSHGVTIDSRVWVKQFASLPSHASLQENGVRVVAFDTRGHGESVSGDTGHSIENLAWDVRTLLETLDLRNVILVGHSMGGVAAQAFAVQFPEIARTRVRGLVLLSSLAKMQVSATRRLRSLAERASDKLELGRIMANPDLGLMLTRLGFGRDPVASHVELIREMLATCPVETGREALRMLIGMDLTPDLSRIDLPTLVIGGTADLLTPPAESRRMARLIPGARLVLLERAGHTIMLERAVALDDLLLDFAREVGAYSGEQAPDAASV